MPKKLSVPGARDLNRGHHGALAQFSLLSLIQLRPLVPLPGEPTEPQFDSNQLPGEPKVLIFNTAR
jgi:hypothetical protein